MSAIHYIGELRVDLWRRVASTPTSIIRFSPLEWKLLAHLLAHRGQAQTRKELLGKVWGITDFSHTRAVDLAIHKLRRKIEPRPKHPEHLLTILRKGYLLKKEE